MTEIKLGNDKKFYLNNNNKKILVKTVDVYSNNSIINTYNIYILIDNFGVYKFSLEMPTLKDPIEVYENPDKYTFLNILNDIFKNAKKW